jgi:hypothetical protein
MGVKKMKFNPTFGGFKAFKSERKVRIGSENVFLVPWNLQRHRKERGRVNFSNGLAGGNLKTFPLSPPEDASKRVRTQPWNSRAHTWR